VKTQEEPEGDVQVPKPAVRNSQLPPLREPIARFVRFGEVPTRIEYDRPRRIGVFLTLLDEL
jgi:hypothetical protein